MLVVSALGVIMVRNPVHCGAVAGAVLLHQRGDLAAHRGGVPRRRAVLVYVGAVMVLFLFVVMMLDINIEKLRAGFTRYAWLGGIVAGVVVVEIVGVVWTRASGVRCRPTARPPLPADYSNTAELGKVLYTEYVYPFELAAVLLLVAIVAAISLTMRKRAGPQGAGHRGAGGGAARRTACASSRWTPREAGRGAATSGEAHDPLNCCSRCPASCSPSRVAGMFLNRKNVILLLMCVELLLLAVNFNFVAFSRYLGDINGQMFVFFVLTVAAAESAIGLAILVVLFRERRSINVEDLTR